MSGTDFRNSKLHCTYIIDVVNYSSVKNLIRKLHDIVIDFVVILKAALETP